MKKLVLSILILLLIHQSFSQSIINRGTANNTLRDWRLMAGYNLYVPRYTDTTQANIALNLGIDSCGAQIFTYDVNAMWYRQCSPKKWVLLSNGNAPEYTADRGVQIITGDIIRLADTIEGAGTKFQYLYNKSGAFRVGTVTGTQWNIANIGSYSFATGSNTTASGLYSFAGGNASSATGASALAIGIGTVASQNAAVALGNLTTASGSGGAMAVGTSTTASGAASFATGQSTLASAATSAAFGNQSKAVGNSAFSSGVGTYMNTLNGVVFGAYNDTTGYYANNTSTQVATDPIFTIGNGSGVGSRSNAFQMLRNGATKFSSGITATTDTTTFKPMVMDASGNVRKTGTWGIGVKNIYNSDGTLTDNRILHGAKKSLSIDSISNLLVVTDVDGYDSRAWSTIMPQWDDANAGHKFYMTNQDVSDTAIYQFANGLYFKPLAGSYIFDNLPVSITPTTDSLITFNTLNKQVSYIDPNSLKYPKNLVTNTTPVGNVGAGEDDLMTYSLAANKLANDGDYLEFRVVFTFNTNANSKQVTLYFGATDFYTTGAQNQNDGSLVLEGEIIRTGASSQLISIKQIGSSSSLFVTKSEYAGASEDLTMPITIKATGIGVSDDDIQQILMIEKYVPAN